MATNRPEDLSRQRAPMLAFGAMVAAGGLIRFFDFLTVPLLENDGVSLMMSARNTLAGQGISPSLTLPSLIVSALFGLFGEGLWQAALPNLIAGFAALWLCHLAGKSAGGRDTGFAAAGLYAVCALALFYAPLPKPYTLLSAFVLAGVVCWAIALERARERAALLGFASGLFFGCAFATHTFAAFAAVPLPFLWIFSWIGSDRKSWRTPTLCAGLGFGVVAGALIAWRFPLFGWSIFNDYLMDWRFEIAIPVWSVRWEGLTNLYSLSPFALLPGLGVYFARKRRRTPIEIYLLALLALNLTVYLLNPVNRFPRVLLPSMAALCVLAAIGLAGEIERRSWAIPVASASAFLGFVLVVAEKSSTRPILLGMLDSVSPGLFALLVVALIAAGAVAARMPSTREASPAATGIALAVFAISSFGFAAVHSSVALSRQAELYQRRVAGLAACGTQSDTLGGGDAVHLLFQGTHNYSWLIDLPRDRLLDAYANDVVSTLEAEGVRCVVIDWKDPEGEVAMLDEFVRTAGVAPDRARNLFQELDEDPRVKVIAERPPVNTYAIGGFEPSSGATPLPESFDPLIQTNFWPSATQPE